MATADAVVAATTDDDDNDVRIIFIVVVGSSYIFTHEYSGVLFIIRVYSIMNIPFVMNRLIPIVTHEYYFTHEYTHVPPFSFDVF